jgi:hypothetical protein
LPVNCSRIEEKSQPSIECAPATTDCCNQVEMSASVQSRNVTLGGVVAWLGWVETSDIGALNSHAGVVILRHVLTLLLPFLSHV